MAASFEETQRFRSPWLWGPVLAVTVPPLLVLLRRREQPGAKVSLVSGALGLGLLAAMHLTVRVDEEGVQLRFFPLLRKRWAWDAIRHAEVCTYRPLRDYGGWGIRLGRGKRNWAYTVSGNRGVRLELSDGKRVLVGSQRPEALCAAIEQGLRASR